MSANTHHPFGYFMVNSNGVMIFAAMGTFFACVSIRFFFQLSELRKDISIHGIDGQFGVVKSTIISLLRMANRSEQFDITKDAGNKIILPCYRPLYLGLFWFLLFLLIAQIVVIILFLHFNSTIEIQFYIVQYHGLLLSTIYMSNPVLLIQHSISTISFVMTASYLTPYFAVASILYFLQFSPNDPWLNLTFKAIFTIFVFIPPAALSAGIMLNLIRCRIQLESRSNRASVEYLFLYSCLFAAVNGYHSATAPNMDQQHTNMTIGLTLVMAASYLFFPLSLHRTLLADSKFWRGIGTRNRDGLFTRRRGPETNGDDTQAQGAVEERSEGRGGQGGLGFDENIASELQEYVAVMGDVLVDFESLAVQRQIGSGATANVYKGTYKKRDVAVKVVTRLDEDHNLDLRMLFKEANFLRSLQRHKNVVEFLGLVVRPPQIAFVLELCARGDLKKDVMEHADVWTRERRMGACLDAAHALHYLHDTIGGIHRDIKTENFLVSENFTVKLGDFGVSTKQHRWTCIEDGERPSIQGTPEYQAPELIDPPPNHHYTTAVDIFALGVTMWEVWSGRECYEGCTIFQINNMVGREERPPLDSLDAPQEALDAIRASWRQRADERPSAADLVKIFDRAIATHKIGSSAGASCNVTPSGSFGAALAWNGVACSQHNSPFSLPPRPPKQTKPTSKGIVPMMIFGGREGTRESLLDDDDVASMDPES